MLRELVKRWMNHKVMVRWLSRFFYYLDRYFIARRSLAPLKEVGLTRFRELASHITLVCNIGLNVLARLNIFSLFYLQIYKEIHEKVRDAVICLVCNKYIHIVVYTSAHTPVGGLVALCEHFCVYLFTFLNEI